jgi:hypothetical protein
MQCPRGQAENRAGRRFCAECGAPLAIPCSACGFSNEPEEKFCDGCGTALTAAPPGAASTCPAVLYARLSGRCVGADSSTLTQ